ncbi:DUF1049 domain-containing protein [Lichenibacterium minor]|uniref:DUF1049 domain-containing protein n=1 Tax=Lichenibacterium minor TaxID=2316528 RepID=A0A4Q2U762_9HYPH|nr:lipopolysaccharide assembly protein LapA domain-containing protein [Lichenibacterium minor]RYC32503.1 DUF1049 domain-containing protein [Lichenibacterium minor]
MKTFLKALVLVPVAILAIAFAVANRQVVSISFDPFSSGDPVFVLAAPLFLLVFFLLTCGVVIGGVASWLGQGRYRSAARRATAEARDARVENARLRTELDIQSRQNREAARLAGASSGPLPALELHDAH